jgi:hypothetical protein
VKALVDKQRRLCDYVVCWKYGLSSPARRSLPSPTETTLTPHSSVLTPHSSLLTPHSSLLTPHSSLLTPHSSGFLTSHTLHSPRQRSIHGIQLRAVNPEATAPGSALCYGPSTGIASILTPACCVATTNLPVPSYF